MSESWNESYGMNHHSQPIGSITLRDAMAQEITEVREGVMDMKDMKDMIRLCGELARC